MAIANYKSFITRLGKMICKNFTDSEFVKTEFDDEFNSNTAYFTINGYSAWACIYDDDDVITVYVASTHTVEIKIDGTQKDAMATAVRRIESLLDEAEIKKAEIDKKAEEEVNADKQDKQEAEEPQPTPEEADREVTYIDFKPEQDYEEERPPHAALEQLRRDSIEPPKIWSCKALKVQEILQKIYEGKTKTSGERLDAYYNHCNNLILASRIFLPECMYRYLERKLSNELVIAGVCPAVIEEAFGYKKTRRKWYWKL